MPSPLETALSGLLAVLEGIPGPEVLRNADRPEQVPAGGLIILRDGERLDEQPMLSPHVVAVEHAAEVEVYAADEAGRDAMVEAVRAAVAADRTLGGAAEHARALSREDGLADFEDGGGAEAVRGALLRVLLAFEEDG